MKSLAASVVFLVIACPFATADELLQTQRFSIVQAASRTILLDHTAGTTWVLQESPSLRWHKVPRVAVSSLQPTAGADSDISTSELDLIVEARKSAVAGESVLVRATVINPTSTPCEGILVSLAPGLSEVTSVTKQMLKHGGETCVWEIERLDGGESKSFEAQLRFAKESVGKSPKLTWTIRERSGTQRSQSLHIAVTESN